MSGASVLALMGPTASGKTDLAMALVDALRGERAVRLISVDSAQVYRGLDVGSAKPDPATLAAYPHELIDVRDPNEVYSAADFVADADRCIASALAAGELPILVGGTMLYFRRFRDGIAELPSADPAFRQALYLRADQVGWPALHAELAAQDPETAAAVHPNNHQRIQRALEVLALTGRGLSAQWVQRSAVDRLGVTLVEVALLAPDRQRLHDRINARFDAMLAAGLEDEVAGLLSRYNEELPALRAAGYRQTADCLAGRFARHELANRGAAATRQLAKRQLTWLRSWPGLIGIEAEDAAPRLRAVLHCLGSVP